MEGRLMEGRLTGFFIFFIIFYYNVNRKCSKVRHFGGRLLPNFGNITTTLAFYNIFSQVHLLDRNVFSNYKYYLIITNSS